MISFTEHPPVPKVLQEALKDYPELVARLQEGLKTVGRRPGMSKAQLTDQFEASIWVLDGAFGDFIVRAGEEVRAAEKTSHADVISALRAREKFLIGCDGHERQLGIRELRAFFD